MARNIIYMPAQAVNDEKRLDKSSLLVRVIGNSRDEVPIAAFIKYSWKPKGAFRITRVSDQSFKVGFHARADFERLKIVKCEHLGLDLILIKV